MLCLRPSPKNRPIAGVHAWPTSPGQPSSTCSVKKKHAPCGYNLALLSPLSSPEDVLSNCGFSDEQH